jgi:hypothetical protein
MRGRLGQLGGILLAEMNGRLLQINADWRPLA